MFQWIQSLSWVVSIVNGIKKLFGKADCAVVAEPPAVVAEPPAAAPAAAPTTATPKKPRRRKPAKPKQQ